MATEEKDDNFDQILEEIEREEKKQGSNDSESQKPKEAEAVETKKEAESESSDSSYYPHIQIMEEEEIDRKDLPVEIQDMISTFNRKKLMAEKRKASEETFVKIRNLSAVIADRIMDWIEKDDEEEEEPKPLEDENDNNLTEEDEDDDNEKESNPSVGIFDGVLGGIFNW